MKWKKVFEKGLMAGLTFIFSYISSNPKVLNHIIPQEITNMTVGAFIAVVLGSIANYLKHKNK